MSAYTTPYLPDYAARIRAQGARATPARQAVLRVLETADRALSHHDIEKALAGKGFDRVTLYRVLDWSVENGLSHRIIDEQRVFRFSIATTTTLTHKEHAHFRCEECGRIFCLQDVAISPPSLPEGFIRKSVEFCVIGHCAQCDRSKEV